MMTLVLKQPPDRNQSCAVLWAFVCIDKEGNESNVAMFTPDGPMPMVFTKWELVEKFRPLVQEMAPQAPEGCRVVLRAYSQATDLEEIK
jgi:hypothetical protein